MRILIICGFTLSLVTAVLSADNIYPFTVGENETNSINGLRLAATATQRVWRTTEFPVITVSLSNISAQQTALLNHFAYCAEGPALTVRILSPNDPRCFRQTCFNTDIAFNRIKPHWIILEPNQTQTFRWPIADKLKPGTYKLQVSYFVGPPAAKMIQTCRQEKGSPDLFWTGAVVSEVFDVEVKD